CVSDPVGGPYIGNARWLGASLASLVRAARPRRGADQLLCTSADGFTSGTPLAVVMDGRDALLAVAMNGAPLPVAHGFPARLAAVPGIDTWRQWALEWDAAPGSHLIEARATDATGYTQTPVQVPPEPNGASGYPSVTVSVQ